jgi:hypothetical protein
MPVLLPSASPSHTRAEQSDAVHDPGREMRRHKSRHSFNGPPKIAAQITDTMVGECPDYFDVSVNVYVVKGRVDDAVVELNIPKMGLKRSRQLLNVAGDYGGLVNSIPVNRTALLKLVVTGPGGTTTESHDVTHQCPGAKLDKQRRMFKLDSKKFDGLKKMSWDELDFGADSPANKRHAEPTAGSGPSPAPTASPQATPRAGQQRSAAPDPVAVATPRQPQPSTR